MTLTNLEKKKVLFRVNGVSKYHKGKVGHIVISDNLIPVFRTIIYITTLGIVYEKSVIFELKVCGGFKGHRVLV